MSPRSFLLAWCCIAVTAATLPHTAWAVDKVAAAASMARQAANAYEAGDYPRASDLYESAWALNPRDSAVLYSAARAAQLAGNLDRADALYRRFLALPQDGTGDYAEKAKQHLAEIPQKRAADQAAAAAQARSGGHPALAAELYHAALLLDPARFAWLLEAARAEQAAGNKEAALADYRAWQDKAPADAAERHEVAAALLALEPPVAAPEVPAVATPRVRRIEATPPRTWPAWTTVAVGGVAAVVGGGLWLSANGQDQQLQRDLAVTDAKTTWITGVTRDAAHSRATEIEGNYRTAAIATSVGVAIVAAGLVWLRLRQAPAAARPPAEPALAVQF